MRPILNTQNNCWRIARADKAAFLVDGEVYFAAIREAVLNAQYSIFLVGWDVHSRLELIREDTDDGAPRTLGPLLNYCARKNPELRIYVLNWDFAMIYTLEREFFPKYRFQWRSHKRVEFCLDDNHPIGASQHQKLVLVDDCMGFSGGFDLAQWRWDTREHRVDDERRLDPLGRSFPTFHDVQIAVSGDAARALAELARARWKGAEGCEIPEISPPKDGDCWPAAVKPALCNVDVAVALTRPEWQEQTELRQVEQLFIDSIASAEKHIYIENQYFTSHRIGEALEASLAQETGPEIVMVLPRESRGWLEQHTMDVLRCRLLRRLRKTDRHERLRVYCPRLGEAAYLLVHAKVMVVDDSFLRIGSANLSNRSMGLDTECDLALESTARLDCSDAITLFRRGLLAEHLGVQVADIAAAEEEHQSLIAAVESLRTGDRTLEEVDDELSERLDRSVPDSAVIDPEKPVEPQELLRYISGSDPSKLRHAVKLMLLLGGLLAMAALWRWTPLSEYLNLKAAEGLATSISETRFAPLLVIVAFTAGSVVVIPLTLMVVATITVFGPWIGTLYALAGGELAAIATFAIGRILSRDAVSRLAGGSQKGIRRRLAEQGMLSIVALRVVPVAPFSIINVVAGASTISLRDFALGSFIGLVPGTVAIALLTDRFVAAMKVPDATSIATLVAAGVAVIAALAGLRAMLRKQRS